MDKFPKIRYPGDSETDGLTAGEVVVTEKFDGANFRLRVESPEEIYIGTRNHSYHIGDENIPKAFSHTLQWLNELSDETLESLSGEGVFYGEAMHLHSLAYENVNWENPSSGSPHVPVESSTPNVIFFDYMLPSGDWAEWDVFTKRMEEAGLADAVTPVLERGDPEELSFAIPDESMLGGPPEGIVARRVDGSVRAKKVTDDFKERNAVAFSDASRAQESSGEFVAQFVTDARIIKRAQSLVDSGEYEALRMEMMEDLPAEVIRDVFAEEGWALMCNEYGFECEFDEDFKSEVRSKTSKKCARVLKTELQEF